MARQSVYLAAADDQSVYLAVDGFLAKHGSGGKRIWVHQFADLATYSARALATRVTKVYVPGDFTMPRPGVFESSSGEGFLDLIELNEQ